MYPSKHARELAILLRTSRELDVIGDVSATVDNPSDLLAWSAILGSPTVAAWRGRDSGHRYVQVTADHATAPVRGRVAAVLPCDHHPEFWAALGLEDLEPERTRILTPADLASAWDALPVSPGAPEPAQSPPGVRERPASTAG